MKTQTIQLDEHEIVIDRDNYEALVEALRQARIALTPHVFIDDDAKRARNKADEALKQAGEL